MVYFFQTLLAWIGHVSDFGGCTVFHCALSVFDTLDGAENTFILVVRGMLNKFRKNWVSFSFLKDFVVKEITSYLTSWLVNDFGSLNAKTKIINYICYLVK